MSLNIDLTPKAPVEVVQYSFDFTTLLLEGETITSASFTVKNYFGYDPHPEDLLDGPLVNTTPIITQNIKGGILNTVYLIRCAAVTDLNHTYLIVGTLTLQEKENHNYG